VGKIGQELEFSGQAPAVQALRRLMKHAAKNGCLRCKDLTLAADAFFANLIGPLQIGLLLGIDASPTHGGLGKKSTERAAALIARLG
jgi:hypothetical protein